MIIDNGYFIRYLPSLNQIVIGLPQTGKTIVNTAMLPSTRKVDLTEADEAAILAVVKAIMEGKHE